MAKNDNLHKAKDAKNDEFYTRIEDVAEELRHYKKHFAGKVVLCNCDDPTWSAFWRYFHLNFAELGLKKLIVHAVAALYNLISDLRPNWLDNEDTSLTLDISIDGRKAQSCGGLVAMKEEGFTFGLED